MSWDEATAPAVDWIEGRAAEEGVEPALMVNTLGGHGSGDDPMSRFEGRYSVVSERSAMRSRLAGGPMLVYVPSAGALERAMRLANGYSICVIEGTLERWHGWAVELGALDLLAGEVTGDERSANARRLSARLDMYANNGFGDALGKQVVPRILRDLLTEGVTANDICGIALARGCGERGVKALRGYLARLDR